MIQSIAFIGATGMLGKPVAKALSRSGFKVTALVRDEQKAKQHLLPEIQIMRGDIRNEDILNHFLAGKDAVYINLNLEPSEKRNDYHAETDGIKSILTVAKRSGIKRIAMISSLVKNYQGMNNFNWWVFDIKEEAIRLVKTSGIPYTLFYPSAFIENFAGNYRQGNRILLSGTSRCKMHFISAEDYGNQVARSFQLLTTESRDYAVQGPEAFTADEAAVEFIKHYKKEKLTIARAPLGLLKILGLFSARMDYASHIIEALNNYPEKFEAENTWSELGKPTTTIRQFAESKNY